MVEHYENEVKEHEDKQPKQSSPPVPEKWSKDNHPAFQADYRAKGSVPQNPTDEAGAVTSFKVNDMVLAKWQGDRSFYPARITAITGSSTNPQYYVKFKTYDNTEIVRGSDIKPMSSNQNSKRKADGTPVNTTSPPPPPSNTNVISAAANVDPELASQARKEPSMATDGPPKPAKVPRKVKANRELEAGKSKWQDFAKGKVGKAGKKDSMFRTPDGINARGMQSLSLPVYSDIVSLINFLVGFTGSGQAMRKDPSRNRHLYQPEDD